MNFYENTTCMVHLLIDCSIKISRLAMWQCEIEGLCDWLYIYGCRFDGSEREMVMIIDGRPFQMKPEGSVVVAMVVTGEAKFYPHRRF
ncbi:hypothetical protein QVD17_09683 [Tagetes erecta]|uniref:Uncharacterized protein n=1 Tax=Tagetes erecta TaxID=13708 RepID=A0AAD8P455_TARER|nr:hypothetical protein QVD17_09683 [Tagetes erecta]